MGWKIRGRKVERDFGWTSSGSGFSVREIVRTSKVVTFRFFRLFYIDGKINISFCRWTVAALPRCQMKRLERRVETCSSDNTLESGKKWSYFSTFLFKLIFLYDCHWDPFNCAFAEAFFSFVPKVLASHILWIKGSCQDTFSKHFEPCLFYC